MKSNHSDLDVIASSGNVFADQEVPCPEEELIKADIALEIAQFVESKNSLPPKRQKISS